MEISGFTSSYPYPLQSREGSGNPAEAGGAEARRTNEDESKKTTGSVEATPLGRDEELEPEQRRQVSQLQRVDRQVRAHEAAHMAAAGGLVRGGATFSYRTGPDGQRYAVGGEVGIDTSAVPGNPQATLIKAQRIRAAATAPADPSAQDRAVAAAATRMAIEAQRQLALQRKEEGQPQGGEREALPVTDGRQGGERQHGLDLMA